VILQQHDNGCRFAREANSGHTDAARRLSDRYNLHKLVGIRKGWISARFADGTADDDAVFPSRAEAVEHSHHNESWTAYIELTAPSMTVCEAASILRFQAHARKLAPATRGAKGGGLIVIPRLNIEDQERQIAALSGRLALPVALGKRE
jgi:hypothetical protein